jgi:methylmalonyl-CoA/ethylmalonyl-CoA epimerase
MIDSTDWRFRHVGMIVRDIDKAIALYQQFGFTFVKEKFLASPAIENPPKSYVAHMSMGGLTIEFIQPLEGKFVNMEFLESIGEGVNHVCYQVDDLPTQRQKLIEAGFPPIYEKEGLFGYFDTRRAGNLIIELRALP